MILKNIELKNFRIHKNTEINFSNNINYIVGGNGQGKTSVLEAIYYLCTTKGYNSASDNEIVNFNENYFEIKGGFKDLTEDIVRVYYTSEENKKYFFLDGKQIHRAAGVIGKFPVVILTPEDHAITQGTPGDRRKFVDSVISQASGTYLKILLEYNKTLRQRSSLLSQIKENQNRNLFLQLDAWSTRLAQTGSEVIKHRINFIKDFNEYVKDSYRIVLDEKEEPEINYSYFNGSRVENPANVEKEFIKLLEEKREDELRRATNLVGPHRDDFIFSINKNDLKKYGSQGQNKTFQITLRFAQFFYLKDKLARIPIFLMDDVFGELDAFRAGKISAYLKEIGQAFVTLTDLSNFSYLSRSENDAVIKIQNGEAIYG